MEINIQEQEPCKLNVTYVADSSEISTVKSKVLEAFKKAPVKGFRDGKASMATIKIVYKDQIADSLKRALAEDAYHNTVFDKKLRPHGAPKFNILSLENNKFTCEFDMMTKPEFDLIDVSSLEIPKPHQTLNVEDLTEQMMQDLRVRFGELNPFLDEDTIVTGDNVIVDYEAFVDGERLEPLCVTGDTLTVGTTKFAEFDSYLIGMKVNEVKEFSVIAPPTSLPSVSGKKVDFKVTLITGTKNTPHPLDDTLATQCGKANLAELRELAHASASAKVVNSNRSLLNEAISLRLLSEYTFEVPKFFTLSEAQYLTQVAKLNWDTISEDDKNMYLGFAEKNVKLALILDKVREDTPEAQLSEQEVFNIVKQGLMQTQSAETLNQTLQDMQSSGQLAQIFARIKDEYALDFIAKTIKVVE